ncbi:MAG TPA: hypothetical protein VH331_06625 [Allosphingosinicella sp.]|nr:hypothetical protein [Allosphingosinicella sp.]
MRNLTAFLLSVVPGALLESIAVALWPKRGAGIFANPFSMFVAMCLLLYLLELIFGSPALLLLGKNGYSSLKAFTMAGLAAVAVPVLALLLLIVARGRITGYAFAYNLIFFAVAGCLAGATFWLVARPDRHAHLKGLRTIF